METKPTPALTAQRGGVGNNKRVSWIPRPGGQLSRVRTTVIWNSSLTLFPGCAALHRALIGQQNEKVSAKAESPKPNELLKRIWLVFENLGLLPNATSVFCLSDVPTWA